MKLSEFNRQIGSVFRLRPPPNRAVASMLAPADDKWRLEAVLNSPSGLRLVNIHTEQSIDLGADNIREYRTPDFLMLRCQLTIRPTGIEIEPFVVSIPDALLTPKSVAINALDLDDILDLFSNLPLLLADSALDDYYGLQVSISGPIWNVTRLSEDRVQVQASTARHDRDVWFEVSLAEHPKLALVQKWWTLTVVGFLHPVGVGLGIHDPVVSNIQPGKGSRLSGRQG